MGKRSPRCSADYLSYTKVKLLVQNLCVCVSGYNGLYAKGEAQRGKEQSERWARARHSGGN
eukprot:2911265-Rhodomonas_salina.1